MESSTQAKSVLVHKGTYGCAFTPPLPCKKSVLKQKSGQKVIGKITTKDEVETELEISTIIKKIPNYSSYFIIQVLDSCSVSNFKQLRPVYSPECEQYADSKNTNLDQLLSLHGGIDLHKLQVHGSFPFLNTLRHVLKGVSLLEEQGLCHSDLHSSNIVRDIRGTARIIDFGMSFLGDTISPTYVRSYLNIYATKFDQQPPEFTVLNGIHTGVSLDYCINEVGQGKKIITSAQNHLGLGMSVDEQTNWMREFFRTPGVYTMAKQDPVAFFKQFWRKMDVWGIGGIFLKLLIKLMLSPLFVETQWKTDGNTIRTVLKGILQSNPNRRLSAKEALALL